TCPKAATRVLAPSSDLSGRCRLYSIRRFCLPTSRRPAFTIRLAVHMVGNRFFALAFCEAPFSASQGYLVATECSLAASTRFHEPSVCDGLPSCTRFTIRAAGRRRRIDEEVVCCFYLRSWIAVRFGLFHTESSHQWTGRYIGGNWELGQRIHAGRRSAACRRCTSVYHKALRDSVGAGARAPGADIDYWISVRNVRERFCVGPC